MESKINISLLKDFLLSSLCFNLRIRTSITKPMVNIPNDTVFFIRHLNYYCSIHYKTSAKFLRGNLDEIGLILVWEEKRVENIGQMTIILRHNQTLIVLYCRKNKQTQYILFYRRLYEY